MSTTEKPLENLDDAALFNDAMNDPEPENQPEPIVQEVEPKDDRPRDEQGRFAPKAETEQVVQPEKPSDPVKEPERIPLAEYLSTRERAQAAEQRAAAIERRYQEEQSAWRAELEKLRNPPKPPPDFFESPEQATAAAVQAAIDKMIAPQLGQLRQTQQQLSQAVAAQQFGSDKVQEAEKAFAAAYESRTLDPAEYHRVMNSPNMYAAAVQWHQQKTVLQQVGTDPEAWFTKRLETWMADPKNQAAVIERARTGAQPNGSRSPTVQLPPSISRATGSAGNVPDDPGDMSDPSLFAYATR